MAYTNFIPEIWSQSIETELHKALVLAEDCNTKYTGDIKRMGDTVHIITAVRPTISHFSGTANVQLESPEVLSGNKTTLYISEVDTFNFKVGDIDEAQAIPGLMSTLTSEASYGLADAIDSNLAKVTNDEDAVKADDSATTVTKGTILNYIDTNLQKLYENNVPRTDKIVLDVPPWFYMMLKQAYIDLDTDNSKMLENGYVGKYGNVIVKMSNNLYTSGGVTNIMLRTTKAVAFAKQLTHIEPYRVELDFADALKGFALYGYKLVRPKEMVVLNATYDGAPSGSGSGSGSGVSGS